MLLFKNDAEPRIMQQLWKSYGHWHETRVNFVSSKLESYEKFYRTYRLKVFMAV